MENCDQWWWQQDLEMQEQDEHERIQKGNAALDKLDQEIREELQKIYGSLQ
jgi:hypothetical protein